MTEASRQFMARLSYWVGQGLGEKEAYRRLASDTEAPDLYDTDDVAALLGIRPSSIKQQRARGLGPAYIKTTGRTVRYTRHALCRYLADRVVSRAA